MRQEIDSMRDIWNMLNNNVLGTLETCWQGEAKDLFSQQFSSFSVSLKKLIDGYDELNSELQAAGNVYQGANDMVLTTINKMPLTQ